MKKLFLLLLLAFLLTFSLAQAPLLDVNVDDYIDDGLLRAEDFGESWASLYDWKNVFEWNDANYENEWYAVSEWEVQQCSRHLSTDLKSVQSPDGNYITTLISDLTITLQGSVFKNPENMYEYDAAWYVQPFEQEVIYSLEVKNGDQWQIVPDFIDVEANPLTGSSDYYTWESEDEYTDLRIVSNTTVVYAVPFVERQ